MVDRVLLGKRPSDSQIGMWISKPGKDISSSDPEDFLFDPTRYNSRAYARFTVGIFTRGPFDRTITFGDGTKADYYFWDCQFFLPFNFVPIVTAQTNQGEIVAAASGTPGLIQYDSSSVLVRSGSRYPYRYNGADASKTPIAGSSWTTANNDRWSYDLASNTMTYFKSDKSTFIIYRNPLF